MLRRTALKLLSGIFTLPLIPLVLSKDWNFKNGSQIKFHRASSPYTTEDGKRVYYGIPYHDNDATTGIWNGIRRD